MLRARAPAKVNLTLHVLGRRSDGFHELDSLVAFAGCAADSLAFEPGPTLALAAIDGPFAGAAGPDGDNLVLKAARAAAERIDGLTLGRYFLAKRIPVAAGLGGGSADAAAALRLLAEANDLAPDDPRLVEAAAATGSDVPACLVSRAARMRGRGEVLEPADMAPLAAVLMNPLKALSTAEVFRRLGLAAGESFAVTRDPSPCKGQGGPAPAGSGGDRPGWSSILTDPHPALFFARGGIEPILSCRNDLEPPARALMPEIGVGLDALAATDRCRLARMSGSGATVFGLYDDPREARRAARALRARLPGWWILPTTLR